VENHWKTDTDVASDLGGDYGDNLETAKREKAARVDAGIADPPASMSQPANPAAPVVADDDPEELPAKGKDKTA
jgi:hypothetical protein